MEESKNILVFPCGAENSIEIHSALKDVFNIKLFGASSIDDHGKFIFKNYIGGIPYISNDNFISELNKIIIGNKIDLIIPTHDDVVLKLMKHEKEIKTKILASGYKQAEICRSKKLTYSIFKDFSFCPIQYNSLSKNIEYPIFIKPDKGQGAKGAYKIDNESLLNFQLNLDENVITEYLPGEELTVDCFSNFKNELKFIGARKRNRIHAGISVNSSNYPLTSEIKFIANTINEKLKLNGLWYFQLKKNKNNFFKLLEISIRVSGTMNLFRCAGVNFPLLAIYNAFGYETTIIFNDFNIEVDRALINRYTIDYEFNNIYIDFDDTITKNDKVNPHVISFIFNAKNNGKKIILITKHDGDLTLKLNQLSINPTIFDEIIHLKKEDKKFQYILEVNEAIFIDNSFSERMEVKQNLNIPVFDVDGISALINWKE